MTALGEKRVTLMGLAEMHSATYEVFLNMCKHTCTQTHICCTYSMCMLPAVVCIATILDSQYHGERDRESTVNHLVSRKQIHYNNAARSAIHKDKILLSAEQFNAGLTSLWKMEVWKSANHLYDCISKKRILNT